MPIVLKEQTAASVATPASGKVAVFIDSATGEPSYKDDAGTAASLKGATGATGAAGTNGEASITVQSVTSAATVTPTFSNDVVVITAQAAALALANPTGTAKDGWGIVIRIKDNGTAWGISYGSQYRALGVTLPTITVIGKTTYLGMIYNATDTKWDVVSVQQEA